MNDNTPHMISDFRINKQYFMTWFSSIYNPLCQNCDKEKCNIDECLAWQTFAKDVLL